MARALPPASFVREAPNNQSALPMTATGHCPVPVLPRRAKTSFPGREAAPLRFAAPSAWVQRGSWAGLRSASAKAATSLAPTCYDQPVDNRTEPRTARQWIRYLVVGVIALFLVWWMLRVYVL